MASSKSGIDALLQQGGKSLQIGQELRLVMVKAPDSRPQADPMDPSAPQEVFPLIAKFGESTVRPDFRKMVRWHQQNIPGYKDDSEDEEAIADAPKKKRRYRRNDAPKRQWLLQEETDYLQHQISKHELKDKFKFDPNQHSTRYEGTAEFSASRYVLLSANAAGEVELVNLAPPHAFQSFRQPAASVAMSMAEAERAIQDSRSTVTRYMMHKRPGQPAAGNSKMRLFGKLQVKAKTMDADVEEDDVMGDVKYEARKGGGSTRARKELLSALGDGVSMDQEGVLGGTNDREFGGKRRFNQHQLEGDVKLGAAKVGSSAGNDGMAMADDFYQRDVKAEYEELDYDANEQFDDDDVDMAEAEVQVDDGGFGDDGDDEDEYEDEDEEEDNKGLASTAGLKAMLARARGETKPEPSETEAKEGEKNEEGTSTRASSPDPEAKKSEPLAQVMAAAERTREAAAAKKENEKEKKAKPTGVEIDEHGQRMLTLEAVQREIWLHHGSIATVQLMKIFGIKKKTAVERKMRFQELLKELCSLTVDPVHGRMMTLKQHYANLRS